MMYCGINSNRLSGRVDRFQRLLQRILQEFKKNKFPLGVYKITAFSIDLRIGESRQFVYQFKGLKSENGCAKEEK